MLSKMLYVQLENFNDRSIHIEASAIVSIDGLVIAAALPREINEDHIGAMSAAILSVSDRSSKEFAGSESEQIVIKNAKGYILMIRTGKDAMFTVITKPNIGLDFILLEMNHFIQKLNYAI